MDISSYKQHLMDSGYSTTTITSYCRTVSSFIVYMERQHKNIYLTSYNDIIHYINTKRSTTSPRTLSGILGHLNRFYEYLIAKGLVTTNPVTDIALQGTRQQKLYTIITADDLEQLYTAFPVDSNSITALRNKVVVGLMVFQGLPTTDISLVTVGHVNINQGVIAIPSTLRSNSRELKLQAVQIIDMMRYMERDRQVILQRYNKETDKLVVSAGSGNTIHNMLTEILPQLKLINPKVQSIKQIRSSVITMWLKLYNLRQVQYQCGHRWVSSTERYKINDITQLTTDILKYHPI